MPLVVVERHPSTAAPAAVGAPGAEAAPTGVGVLLLLPGYGDDPALFLDRLDLIDPDGHWHVAVATPPIGAEEGPAWFTVGLDGPDPAELAHSVEAVAAVASELQARTGAPARRVVVAGYSQGGAVALAALLDPSVEPPGAVAALASYLPHREGSVEPSRAGDRPVLVAHGADDEVVDLLQGRSAARVLHRAGAAVTWAEVGGDHALDEALLEPLRRWLADLATGATPIAPPT